MSLQNSSGEAFDGGVAKEGFVRRCPRCYSSQLTILRFRCVSCGDVFDTPEQLGFDKKSEALAAFGKWDFVARTAGEKLYVVRACPECDSSLFSPHALECTCGEVSSETEVLLLWEGG